MPTAGIAAVLIGITLATVFYFFFPSSEEEPTTTSAHYVERRSNISNRLYECDVPYTDRRRRRSQSYERRCNRVASGTCSICLESLSIGMQVILNPCEHSFHKRCIDEWVSKANQASCPNCRCNFR